MKIIVNNKEKYILSIFLGFFLGTIISLAFSLCVCNNLKNNYEKQINDAYINGVKVGKEKGLEECQEIIKSYKPFYN